MTVFLSDFNCVLKAEYRASGRVVCDRSSDILSQIISKFDLDGVGEYFDVSKGVKFTHFQGQSHARFDRIYLYVELMDKFNGYAITMVHFFYHCQ